MTEKRRVTVDGETFEVELSQDGNRWTATIDGQTFEVQVEGEEGPAPRARRTGSRKSKSGNVSTTIPGKVVTIEVAVGQSVREGDVVLVLEAMKMQNEVAAPISGTVTEINCAAGENVEANVPLIIIEAEGVE
jgi:biotin carboxyl carrier protein